MMTDARAHAGAISEIDQKDFFEAMSHNDPLSVAIKAAIFLDNQLNELIEERVASPEHIKKLQLDYAGRVHLVAALGFPLTLVSPLLALGNIRNKFAHRLNAEFAEGDADNFYKTFSPEHKLLVEQVYQQTRKKLSSDRPAKSVSLPPLDRLALYAVTLRAALVVARSRQNEVREQVARLVERKL